MMVEMDVVYPPGAKAIESRLTSAIRVAGTSTKLLENPFPDTKCAPSIAPCHLLTEYVQLSPLAPLHCLVIKGALGRFDHHSEWKHIWTASLARMFFLTGTRHPHTAPSSTSSPMYYYWCAPSSSPPPLHPIHVPDALVSALLGRRIMRGLSR